MTIFDELLNNFFKICGKELLNFLNSDVKKNQKKAISDHLFSQVYTQYLDTYRMTTRERYKRLLLRCPEIVQCINLKDIASYLKVTPTTIIVGWTFVIDMLYHILEQQGHGHLVAITSAGGLRGEAMAPAYSATKAYQINYVEALRKKAFKNGEHIIVTDIRPGLVDTAMAKGEGLFWVMPVEKVARQIISAIRKKKSKAYVTRRWHILAIINKNLPFFLYKRL